MPFVKESLENLSRMLFWKRTGLQKRFLDDLAKIGAYGKDTSSRFERTFQDEAAETQASFLCSVIHFDFFFVTQNDKQLLVCPCFRASRAGPA